MKTTTLKRKLALFTAVIMALTLWTAVPFQASAGDPDVYTDGTLAYTLDEEHNATITGYAENYAGDITTLNIPASIADNQNEGTYYDVTAIGDYAFEDIPTETLVIGDGVKSIGDSAFSQNKITVLVIPDSVESIGDVAFGNSFIETLIIGDGVKSIGEGAFGDNLFTSIVIPASVESIGDYAFQTCSALTKVEILNNSGEMTIGMDVFGYCEVITDVTVPQAVLDAEGGISALFPDSAGSITTVTIADGVTEIPAGAFEGLDSLETIVLPDSITTIEEGAFDDLESLTEITIPDSVTIGEGVLPDDLSELQIWCYNGSAAHTAAGANAVVMIESIKLNKTAVSLNLNGTRPLTASVATPAPASVTVGTPEEMPEEITWSSSKEAVATVDNEGNVTAAGYGSAKITATIIPHSGATLTATCTITVAPPAPATYAVTVGNGTGSGSFVANATVIITANAPAEGKVFDTWASEDGVTFASATSAATSFVMPAKAVTVTATYKDETVNPPVDPPETDDGWVYENGVWKFYADGEVATGWIHDGTAWYYLDPIGAMKTGWLYDQSDKAWYYLAGNGAMKTGWVKDNGNWYYLSGNGAMIAGKWLHDTDGSWYYLSGNGTMLTGTRNVGGKVYLFKGNGAWIG